MLYRAFILPAFAATVGSFLQVVVAGNYLGGIYLALIGLFLVLVQIEFTLWYGRE